MEFLSSMFETVPVWLVWSVVVGIALYWYFTKPYNHWKKVGIPHVSPVPIVGTALQLFLKNLHEVQMEQYKEHGRIFGAFQGRIPVLVVADPDVVRNILVKDFQFFTGRQRLGVGLGLAEKMVFLMHGEDWKRVRSIMTPAFSTGKIKRMTSIFSDSAKTLLTNFSAAVKEGKPIDMKRLFGAFTMDVIASSAFATKLDSHNDPDNPFVSHARNVATNRFPWRFILFFTFPEISRFFRIGIFPPKALEFFEKVTLQIVEDRKKNKQRRNDYLQLLLDAVERSDGAKDAEDNKENEEIKEMGHEEGNEEVFKSYQSKKPLSNMELVANSVIFFLVGYDTTASTLTFAAYQLALNPDVQDKLIAEIDDTIREKGKLDYEAIYGMKYLDNVISETLRKYPPALQTDRVTEEDYEIQSGDIKVTVTKGNLVAIPIYAMHHDPEYYPDPERFDPDRFTPEEKAKRHPYAYIPFGAGPRNCVAMRFALMEIKVCLTNILTQFRFRTNSKTQIPIKFTRGTGMLQPKTVLLSMEPRSDASKL